MACVYTFNGKEHSAAEFMRVLSEMHPLEAAKFMPEVHAVPKAPFVGAGTDAWASLSMKRMIRYAAENGYDRISWDTGATNADRYDLSKQVDYLLVKKNADGTYKISAQAQSRGHMLGEAIPEAKLEDHVGKDVAKRIMAGEGKDENLAANNYPPDIWKKLQGADLKVGGEGMKGFYDQILPAAVGKLVKKYGAKVDDIRIPAGPGIGEDDLRQMVRHEERHGEPNPNLATAHSLQITPELRRAASVEGFPLYAVDHAKLTPRAERDLPRIAKDVAEIVNRVGGRYVRGLEFPQSFDNVSREAMRASGAVGGEGVPRGSFNRITRIVKVALATGEERSTGYHEAFHPLEDAVTSQERRLLDAEKGRIEDYVRQGFGASAEQLARISAKEKAAYAFEEYATRKDAGDPEPGRGLHAGIRRVFERMLETLRRVRNYLRGAGYQTLEDFFAKARSGEIGQREPSADKAQEDESYATLRRDAEAAPDEGGKPEDEDRLYFANQSFMERQRQRLGAFDPTAAREFIDDLHQPVKAMQEGAAEGRRIDPSLDIYKAKRLLPGKLKAAREDFHRDYIEPLRAFAKESGLSRQDISNWLYGRHAPERNAAMDKIDPTNEGRGSGISDERAQKIIARLTKEGKAEALKEVEGHIARIRDYILDRYERDGLLSAEQADAYRKMYKHYVPLRGFEDPTLSTDEARAIGRGRLRVAGPETRKAFGRPDSIPDDPLANLLDMADRAIARGEKNKALGTAWRFFNSLPKEALEGLVSFDRGKPEKAIDPKTGLMTWREEPGWRHREDAVPFKIGGKPHYMVFDDPRLAQALMRLSPDQLPKILQPLASLRNFATWAWTHANPDFLLRHFGFRYPVEALLNAGEHGPGAMLESLRGYPFGESFQAIRAYEGLTRDQREALATSARPEDATLRYYDEIRRSGGLMGVDFNRVETTKKWLDKALGAIDRNPALAAAYHARAMFEAVDHVTGVMDNAQRLTAYVEARKRGLSPIDAAMAAREATVDFALKGRWANWINLFSPFGNTAIQTSSRGIRAVARSANMRRVVAGAAAVGAAAALYSYLAGGEDEDGTPWVEKLGEQTRRLNLVLPSPLKDAKGRPYFAQIPLPYNYAFPFAVGAGAVSLAMHGLGIGKDDKGKILGRMLHSGLEALTPLPQEESLLGKITPEQARPFLHVAANENFYGGPVHAKDEPWKAGTPHAAQGFRTTQPYWKTLARFVENKTGYDRYPEDYRETLGYFTSSLERLATRAVHAGDAGARGETPDLTDVLLLHVMTAGGKQYEAADRQAYYDARDKARNAEGRLKYLQNNGDFEAARQWRADHRGDLSMGEAFKDTTRQLGAVAKQIDALDRDTSLSWQEREARIERLEAQRLAIMRRINASRVRVQQRLQQPTAAP